MINEPWRIGAEDYVRASGLETEFDERKHRPLAGDSRAQWFASFTHLKQEWRTRVITALDGGVITIETEGLHRDALGLIHSEITARKKRVETARRAEIEATNTYDTVDQLNVGEKPWCRRFHERVTVIRKHRSSVEVKTSRNNIFKIPLAERSLKRMSPTEIEAEVRKAPGQADAAAAPAPTTETPAAEAPPANNAGSEIVKSENEGTETIDATEIRVEVIDASSMLVHVGPETTLPMRTDFEDGQPRVRDEDLATWLGYERPRDIRQLIDRLAKTKKLMGIRVRGTAPQTSGGRPAREFWLTERETLLVATQSETPKAWELTTRIVDVFRAVVAGGPISQPAPRVVQAAAPTGLSVESVKEIVASAVGAFVEPVLKTVEVQMNALRQEMRERDQRTPPALSAAPPVDASTDLTAGTRHAREITGRITKAAHIAVASGLGTFGKTRKQFEDRVRSAIGFPRASAHRWENLPMCRLGEARLAVAQIESEVQASAEKHFRASQLRLIPGGATT